MLELTGDSITFGSAVVLVLTGVIGALAAAATFQDKSLGAYGNSLSGAAGGVLGGGTLGLMIGAHDNSLIQDVAGAGSGGALLMLLAGFIIHRPRR